MKRKDEITFLKELISSGKSCKDIIRNMNIGSSGECYLCPLKKQCDSTFSVEVWKIKKIEISKRLLVKHLKGTL